MKSFTQEIWDGNISTAVTATRGAILIEVFKHFNCVLVSLVESKVHTYTHQLVASGDVTKLREILAENPTLVK